MILGSIFYHSPYMSTERDSEMASAMMIESEVADHQVTKLREPQTQQTMPLPERIITNEEAMMAQALSKIKKNAKVLENTTKMITKVLDLLKRVEKESASQARESAMQNKKLILQIAQLQKRIMKMKSNAVVRSTVASKKKKKGKRKTAARR